MNTDGAMEKSATRDRLYQQRSRARRKLALKEDVDYFREFFPERHLQKLNCSVIGKSDFDYGKHKETLQVAPCDGGSLIVGWMYENNQKFIAHKRLRCRKSEYLLPYIKRLMSAIHQHTEYKHPLYYIRIEFLRGVMTSAHTDTFRGQMNSCVLPLESPYKMHVHLFPSFRTSVVCYQGQLIIPFRYKEKYGMSAYRFSEGFQECFFPQDSYKYCTPFGEFDFVVVGKRQGRLVIAPEREMYMTSPRLYKSVSFQEARSRLALCSAYPKKMYRTINRVGKFSFFKAWKHVHWVIEGDRCKRLSIFFRPCRENISCANDFAGKGKSFVDMRHLPLRHQHI